MIFYKIITKLVSSTVLEEEECFSFKRIAQWGTSQTRQSRFVSSYTHFHWHVEYEHLYPSYRTINTYLKRVFLIQNSNYNTAKLFSCHQKNSVTKYTDWVYVKKVNATTGLDWSPVIIIKVWWRQKIRLMLVPSCVNNRTVFS